MMGEGGLQRAPFLLLLQDSPSSRAACSQNSFLFSTFVFFSPSKPLPKFWKSGEITVAGVAAV